MTKKYDVLIAGAGLSGLLAASLSAKKGLKVCVLEKNPKIGGMIQPFDRKGISFETGMNFFGAYKSGQIQNILFEIFDIADIEISDIPGFIYLNDNKKYFIPNNYEKFYDEISKYFPEEKNSIAKFIESVKNITDGLNLKNIYGNNEKMFEYFSQSAEKFITEITDNKGLRQIFKYNSLLSGYNPESTSLYLYALITGTFLYSAGMFKYGTKDFISRIENKIIKNKGDIFTKKEITEFKTSGNKIVKCVCSDGSEFEAEKFISTLHPKMLLPKIKSPLLKSFYRKRIQNLPETEGAFILNILLKPGKIHFSDKPQIINFKDEGKNKQMLFYTPFSGKKENFAETVKIMTNDFLTDYENFYLISNRKKHKTYQNLTEEKAKKLIKTAEKVIPGFEKSIINIYPSSPLTFKDYTGSFNGSSYGILKDYRHPEQSIIPVYTKFKNLFLAGQNINFHGMTGVSVTALAAVSAVLNEHILR